MKVYEQSAHKGVNCEQCHSKPGPFFFLTAKLEALQQPIAQLTGDYQKPIVGYVLNQSCRRCHNNDLLFHPVSKNGIRVQHKHLIEAGFLCMRCHSTVAHGNAVPSGSRTYPSMDQCLICHNNHYTDAAGQVATARCDLCHVKPPPGRSAPHPQGSARGPSGTDRSASSPPAPPATSRRTPAPAATMASRCRTTPCGSQKHGATVKALGRKVCSQCHDIKTYCHTCHQVAMPHPVGWIGKHPAGDRPQRHRDVLQLSPGGELPSLPRAAQHRAAAGAQAAHGSALPAARVGRAGRLAFDPHGALNRG